MLQIHDIYSISLYHINSADVHFSPFNQIHTGGNPFPFLISSDNSLNQQKIWKMLTLRTTIFSYVLNYKLFCKFFCPKSLYNFDIILMIFFQYIIYYLLLVLQKNLLYLIDEK